MKRCLAIIFIFVAVFLSCSASKKDEKTSESGGINTVIEKASTVIVNSVDEILSDIEKQKRNYRFYSRGGELKSLSVFIFGTKSKIPDSFSSETYYENIPVIVYKGSFPIHSDDWKKLSDSLKSAKKNIRVTLDFSECKMESLSDLDAEKKNPCWYLPSESFKEVASLTEIYLPEGITAIGSWSFSGCENLRAVFFPKNTTVHSVGFDAFSSNPSLEEVHIYNLDGELGECFRDSGTIATVEMPAHPVFLQGYGAGYHQCAFGNTDVEKIITPDCTFTLDEWAGWCRAMRPKTGVVKEAKATSELDAAGGKYKADNIANANWTSWVEGSSGDGSGESVTLTLAEPTTLSYLCIKNGFGNLAYYWTNNRAKEVTVILDGDEKTAEKHTLSDTPLAQYIYLQKYDKLYSKITLRIESVYKGTDSADDCAIDEIGVNAGIARREVYGGYYDTESVPYVYDPEIQRMLKGLYTLDVGAENVRVSKEGFVQVRATDWESGERYWKQPSGAFSGTLYNKFFPGTGGGHSYDKFHIYLNPDGRHFLFIWREEGYGTFELFPPALKIYAWQNLEWKRQTAENHLAALNEIFSSLSFIGKKNFSYGFYISESDSAEITVYPKDGALNLPVPLVFDYDEKSAFFLPFKKTVLTELAFGNPDTLKSLGDWKNEYEATQADRYEPVQIFCYPACFNRDASVVRFLQESGLQVENEYKNEKGEEKNYEFTALESWQAGKNTNEVRAALINAGAEYSPEMLVKAFDENDLALLKELLPLVKPEKRSVVLKEISENKKSLEYVKSVLLLLRKNGVDIAGTFYHGGMKKNITLMDAVFALDHLPSNALELVTFYHSLGLPLPESVTTWDGYGGYSSSIAEVAMEWNKSYFDDEDDIDASEKKQRISRRKNAEAFLDYLLKNGVSINARAKNGGYALHIFCVNTNRADVATVRLLLEKGANPNVKNEDGLTPFALLVKRAKESHGYDENVRKIAELLLSHGADLNIADKNGKTALSYLIENSKRYDKPETDIDEENVRLWLILQNELEEHREELSFADFLLENGADANCIIGDEYDPYLYRTALYKTAVDRQPEMLNLLIEHGADPNLIINYPIPPLFSAMRAFPYNGDYRDQEYLEIIKTLVQHGANCKGIYEDKYGEKFILLFYLSPEMYPSMHDSEIGKELMELFLSHGAADGLTEKELKKAGFGKEERKYILGKKIKK